MSNDERLNALGDFALSCMVQHPLFDTDLKVVVLVVDVENETISMSCGGFDGFEDPDLTNTLVSELAQVAGDRVSIISMPRPTPEHN